MPDLTRKAFANLKVTPMMILSKNDIRHLIEVVQSDLETTIDMNSLKPGDMSNATAEVISYCEKSKQLLEGLRSALSFAE